jgi:hypothetical protein
MIRRDALTRRAQTDAVGIVASVHGRLVALGIVDWTTSTSRIGRRGLRRPDRQ